MPHRRSDAADVLQKRLKQAFKESRFTSQRQLSGAADLSAPMTQRILSGHYSNSRVGPGVFTIQRIAAALDVPLGFLLGEDLNQSNESYAFFNGTNQPKGTIERLMETHWRGAGRLEAFSNLIEDCDQYQVPAKIDTTPTILRVGKRTPFAGRLNGPFQRDAQRELDGMTEEKRADILKFHRTVVTQKTAIGNSFLDHPMVTRTSHVRASNSRLGLLVTDQKGNQSILIHAMPIPV